MFLSAGGQFSCHCFLRRLSFPLRSFPLWCSWTDRVHVGSLRALCAFLESTRLCSCQVLTVGLPTAPWCGLKSERKMPPAVFCFSESFWLFKVLFNISSLILGLFLFLWKMPLNIILWLQSVYLLMALVGMDIWIPHCSSAWVWNNFLFLCVFFGFFSSALEFSDYWSFMSLIKFVARCFILFDAIISGIFLIFVSDCY